MKQFAIFGTVVDTDDMRYTFEDVTPAQFRAVVNKLEDGEGLELQINSPGGSVYGGIAIANMIRQLSRQGHKVTARVEGLAASIASVIACACDKIVMGESSMMMIHNCWSVVQGDSNALRKEADTMDTINDAIISFYLSKFDLTKEVLKQMMNEETWFIGKEAQTFKFNCEVTPDARDFKIAAMVKGFDFGSFKNTPKALREMIMENKDTNETKADATPITEPEEEVKVVVAEAETVETETVEETVESAVEEEATTQVEEEPVVEEPEMVTKADCDKRVSGMQSAMAKQMNDLKKDFSAREKDYEAKIEDFTKQLKVKDEELISVKAQITSLTADLESAKKVNEELLVKASALESTLADKTDALAKLNAEVNTPNETFNWKTLKGKEFFDYVKKHPELVK